MGESFLAGQDGSGKNRAAIETGSYSFVAGSKTTWSMNKTVSLKREPKIIVIKFLGKVDSSSTDLYGETTYSTSYRYRYAVWLADGKEGSSSNQVSNLGEGIYGASNVSINVSGKNVTIHHGSSWGSTASSTATITATYTTFSF